MLKEKPKLDIQKYENQISLLQSAVDSLEVANDSLKIEEALLNQIIVEYDNTIEQLNNEIDKSIKILNENMESSPNDPLSNSAIAIILASKGQNLEAQRKMDIALANSEKLIHVHHIFYQLGIASALMNNKKIAVEWLKKAAISVNKKL